MKEIKLKSLWAVDINGIQWNCFKYKKDAKQCEKRHIQIFGGSPQIIKRKVLTDKY